MTQGSSAGLWSQGGGGAEDANFLLATVPAGAVLTKVDVQGWFTDESVEYSGVAGGSWTFRNLTSGVQWTQHGVAAVSITATPINVGSWLRLSCGLTVDNSPFDAQSAVANTLADLIGFRERWRGLFYVPSALDLYWSYGENTAASDTINWRTSGSWYVEWATYP